MSELFIGALVGFGLGAFTAYMLATHLGLATLQADVASIIAKIESVFPSSSKMSAPPTPTPPPAPPTVAKVK